MYIQRIKQAREISIQTKSQIFKTAWAVARQGHRTYGGKVSEFFVGALLDIYATIRAAKSLLARALRLRISHHHDSQFIRDVHEAHTAGGEYDPITQTWLVPNDVSVDWSNQVWHLVET